MPTYAEIMAMNPPTRHDVDSTIDLYRKGQADEAAIRNRGAEFEQQMKLSEIAEGSKEGAATTAFKRQLERDKTQQGYNLDQIREAERLRQTGVTQAFGYEKERMDRAKDIAFEMEQDIGGLKDKRSRGMLRLTHQLDRLKLNKIHNHRIAELGEIYQQNRQLKAEELIVQAGRLKEFLSPDLQKKLADPDNGPEFWAKPENKWALIHETTAAAMISNERDEAKTLWQAGTDLQLIQNSAGGNASFEEFWKYDPVSGKAGYAMPHAQANLRSMILDGSIFKQIEKTGNIALNAQLQKLKFNWITSNNARQEHRELEEMKQSQTTAFRKKTSFDLAKSVALKTIGDIDDEDSIYVKRIRGWIAASARGPASTDPAIKSMSGLKSALLLNDNINRQIGLKNALDFLTGHEEAMVNPADEDALGYYQSQPGFQAYKMGIEGLSIRQQVIMTNQEKAIPAKRGTGVTWPVPGSSGTGPKPVPEVGPGMPEGIKLPPTSSVPYPSAPSTSVAASMPQQFAPLVDPLAPAPFPAQQWPTQETMLAYANQQPAAQLPPGMLNPYANQQILNPGILPAAPVAPQVVPTVDPSRIMNVPAPLPLAQSPYPALADPNSILRMQPNPLAYDPYPTQI